MRSRILKLHTTKGTKEQKHPFERRLLKKKKKTTKISWKNPKQKPQLAEKKKRQYLRRLCAQKNPPFHFQTPSYSQFLLLSHHSSLPSPYSTIQSMEDRCPSQIEQAPENPKRNRGRNERKDAIFTNHSPSFLSDPSHQNSNFEPFTVSFFGSIGLKLFEL